MSDFLDLARIVAQQSTYKVRVGAVLVRNGKPIAVGCNKLYSHPKWCAAKHTTLHAEMACLAHTGACMRGATIYVYRQRKDGSAGLARPCAHCMALLVEAGIKKVVYSIAESPFYAVERI